MSASNNGDGGSQGQRVGPNVISTPNAETRTLNHRGTEVDSSNVTRSQNTTGSLTEVLSWSQPRKYEEMVFSGGKHWTKAELRGVETFSGDGTDPQTFSLTASIQAIGGETALSDQPFRSVVAYDTGAGSEIVPDEPDYENDEVTFSGSDAPNNATDNVKIWFVINEGEFQYRAEDAFEHEVGPVNEWPIPSHVFADFDQDKNQTQVHVPGAARFGAESETLKLMVDSDRQVVWSDSDYPRGQYVSRVEQRLDVMV
jgi:hypothetical protein